MTARVRLLGEAVAFLAAVDRTIDHLSRWPLTGALIEGVDESLEVRRMTVGSFPYYVAYVTSEEHITILAVAHERRRPRYWSSRTD